MTAETRRNILRYGIAIDLVILATGAGMLFDPPSPGLLIGVYAGAVALSSWRGGWKGAAAALALSIAVLLLFYPGVLTVSHLVLFGVLAAIATATLLATLASRSRIDAAGSSMIVEAAEPIEVPVPPQLSLVAPFRDEEAPAAETRPTEAEPVAQAAKTPKRSRKKRRASDALPLPSADAGAEETDPGAAQEQAAERLAAELAIVAREAEEREARRRAEEERAAEAQAEAERAAARAAEEQEARVARELEERLESERQAAEAGRERAAEEARAQAERDAQARLEEEQRRAAALAEQLEAERRAAHTERERLLVEAKAQAEEEARRKFEEEQTRLANELEARLVREREDAERQLSERLEAEKRAVEENARRQLEEERAVMRAREEALEAELRRKREESVRPAAAAPKRVAVRPAPSLVDTLTGWFRRGTPSSSVNLTSKRIPANGNATNPGRRPVQKMTKPRLLMIERRRATADAVLAKLRQRGIEAEVVERWVDAVDEIFRFKPHALCLDVEHPDFNQIHRTISEKSGQLPIVLTGRSAFSAPATARHAAFVVRPYDVDELSRLAHDAHTRPAEMLNQQKAAPRTAPVGKPAPRPTPVPPPAARTAASAAAPEPSPRIGEALSASVQREDPAAYEVACYSCRASFSAVDADWCSCLAKERTLVCTNCLACFCKAPPSYKEKFWVEAPPRLFERKSAEARRGQSLLPENPARDAVVRPLVLTVEDDEEIQAIVQRVCTNLGYGFIWATNGQDGLDLARAYRPNLILSDAFMPKLDGREMCRILKESNELPDTRMVVMTGLYTDTKYRSEAVKRFHVDDYVAKPVAITELINILQKHLEGVTGLPAQEDLHEVHRAQMEEEVAGSLEQEIEHDNDIPLADIIAMPARRAEVSGPKRDTYEVSCFNCEQSFEATHAEWCSCVGRDNTLLCPHCHGCFCKAPAGYRERFWIDAPSSLFERKMIGSKRQITIRDNPPAEDIKRPMILLVEDDENVQLIVRTVVSSMGYGFVVGANGQEGLALAREYNPELILSDAFMPKLDGREMCRLLKEDPSTAGSKAIIMTGLYTDRKYRNEALDYFRVDDYVAKPLAVDDLIRLFKKHLPQEVAKAN